MPYGTNSLSKSAGSADQAKFASTFTITNLGKHGLFIPTGFQKKAPFGGSAGYNYFLMHGGPDRALFLARTEDLIRPADWTDRKDPKTADFPNYGFYSVGVECHRGATNSTTVPNHILEELAGKIPKIGKGTYNYALAASYSGNHQHRKMQAGGGDQLQMLTRDFGISTGKEKYFVARSEHCTIVRCDYIL